ncbi:phosphotransferase family protein [Sulfurovum sp. XGS-02]|uniref:choline/ethanolamine kinase family protein n=1 Tax=Sulfurovum sp. XGS-02 TaxID=2925411 RepID=UPI00206FE6B9|nr:choline/ethanolamine kinase family protein [Sulfurovum sp. XGS-02]UPT78008.1 phosphotransferase family protein [Sulfurovum sp. XGS-02]
MIDQLKQYTLFENRTIDSFELMEMQGYCNENYLIHSEEKKYILRKFIRTDVDRKFEFAVQTLAFEKGVASEPLLLDEENVLAISAYVEGIHKESLEKNDLHQFAEVLKKVHTLKIDSDPLVLEPLFETKSKAVQEAFVTLGNFPSEYVLCHNDLNPRNVLFSETIQLIDWEDAAINDRYFDLASVCVEFNLDQESEAYFLRRYFTEEDEINDQKLKAYKIIYKALCTQWFENLESQKSIQQTPPPQGD